MKRIKTETGPTYKQVNSIFEKIWAEIRIKNLANEKIVGRQIAWSWLMKMCVTKRNLKGAQSWKYLARWGYL